MSAKKTYKHKTGLIRNQVAQLFMLAIDNPKLTFQGSYLREGRAFLFECKARTRIHSEVHLFIHLDDEKALDALLAFEDTLIDMIAKVKA